MLSDYLVALFAHLTFFLLLIFIGWMLYSSVHRRKLLSFFGMLKLKTVRIYVSNLTIPAGGAIGQGGLPRSYQGTAIPYSESVCASEFRDLFNWLIPHLSDQPGFLKHILFSDARVELMASPLNPKDIDPYSTVISTGSPGYNVVSDWIQQNLNPIAKFDANNTAILLPNLPPITNTLQCFVQRIWDHDHHRMVFYTAGLSEPGTMGAIAYLHGHWRELEAKYDDKKEFCVLVQVNSNNHRDSKIVHEDSRP